MAESNAESRLRRVETIQATMQTETSIMRKQADEDRGSDKDRDKTSAELRQQVGLLLQRTEELQKHREKSEARQWWFVTAIIGALFALVAALVKR